jgi:hypothetical protein
MSVVKSKFLISIIFIAVFALSRIPHLMPWNFSVAYAFAFCAGVYFRGAAKWWLPLAVMLVTDIALNVFHYHVAPFGFYLILNYALFGILIGLGNWFGPRANFLKLILGGLLGATIFYLISNTLTWLQDSYYAKSVAGWIQALTVGHTDIHPSTWEFFRNTFLSTGIFTALFVGAEKIISAESPVDKTAGAREPETENEPQAQPKDAKA